MKKIRYLLVMLVLASGLVSCQDFFDTTSTSEADDSALSADPGYLEEQIQVIYSNTIFGGDRSYRNRLACGYQGLNTDIEYCNKSDAEESSRYNCSLTDGQLSREGKDPWAYLNKAITQCNYVISLIDTTTTITPKVKYLLGEALTLRAFVYLEMVKFWGDVPAYYDDADAYPVKTDRNDIYEKIRSDLKNAAELMGWSEDIAWAPAKKTITRPNKAFALGLLARVDMMYAGYALRPDSWIEGGGSTYGVQFNVKEASKRQELYQEALNACGEVIAHYGDTKLKSTFDGVFKDICQDKTSFANTEWLWVMPFANNTRGQFMNYNCPKSSDALSALVNNVSGSTNSVQMIVPTFIYDFEAGDTRKWITVAPFSWAADNASGVASDVAKRQTIFDGSYLTLNDAEKILYQKNVDINKAYLGKYRVEWMSRSRTSSDDGVDYPIMRYADILLMYAEASLGGNSGDAPSVTTYAGAPTPQEAFDKVRARAGLASKTLSIENIINERAFEFCGEYIRKYDLERWGILKSKLVTAAGRLTDLNLHQGEFAGMTDNIYIRYKNDDSMVMPNYSTSKVTFGKGYVIDTIYGLAFGENSEPASYASNPDVWVKKNAFGDTDPRNLVNNYLLYANENIIDKRHYWPIFQVNVASSNGSLWNDYDY